MNRLKKLATMTALDSLDGAVARENSEAEFYFYPFPLHFTQSEVTKV